MSTVDGLVKLREGLYVERKSDKLFLVMEKVNRATINHWISFCNREVKALKATFEISSEIRKSKVGGYAGFLERLQAYVAYQLGDEVPLQEWQELCEAANVSYVASTPPEQRSHELWILFASAISPDAAAPTRSDQIEMACTVSTAEALPFSYHMGITRTSNPLPKHPNISMDLHGFGAKVIKMLHPEKVYMLANPLKHMRSIFINALGEENVHREGINGVIVIAEDRQSLQLKDPEGNKLIHIDRKQIFSTHAWLFCNGSNLFCKYLPLIAVSLDRLATSKQSLAK